MVFIAFILLLAILYFPTKYIAEYFEAQRTGFFPILFSIILVGLISNVVEKNIDQVLIGIIISLLCGGWVYQLILGTESYLKGLYISILSQIAIVIFSLVILGGLAIAT